MTEAEMRDEEFVANALPGLESQTGLRREAVHFSIDRSLGMWDYIIARPRIDDPFGLRRSPMMAADPDRWWVWNETEGWISQAVFDADGFIDRPFETEADEGGDVGEVFPAWEGRVVSGEESSSPRDPNAPVTMSIDLEEHEAAKREGLPAWEEHDRFAVLVNANGFAVVYSEQDIGIVRYHDKTACTIRGRNAKETREQAEKFLADRPYKNAYERVLEEPAFDAPDPEPEPFEPPTSPAVPRAKPEKRVWKTVPIASGEEDD